MLSDALYQRRVAPGSMPAVGEPERAATRGIDVDRHARRLQPGELRIEAADDEGDRTLLLPGAGRLGRRHLYFDQPHDRARRQAAADELPRLRRAAEQRLSIRLRGSQVGVARRFRERVRWRVRAEIG